MTHEHHMKQKHTVFIRASNFRKPEQIEPPRASDLNQNITNRTSQNQSPRYIAQIQFKSSSNQIDPRTKFEPSSNQFLPTSCQLRIGQYARTISHDSPAPHSYYPTMGRRQRRQPVNPPRCSLAPRGCPRRYKPTPQPSQAQAVVLF